MSAQSAALSARRRWSRGRCAAAARAAGRPPCSRLRRSSAPALAFVPVVGYLEALAVPLFGLRLRRNAPDKHAGLRTLARD